MSGQGTWQFMSAALLWDVNKGHTISNDLESLLHVLMWMTLHYVLHNMHPAALDDHLQHVFNEYSHQTSTGGLTKGALLDTGSYIPSSLELKWDSPILKLLCALSVPYLYVYTTKHMFMEDFEIKLQASSKLDADLHNKHIELTKSLKWFERTIDAVLNGNNTPWPASGNSHFYWMSENSCYSDTVLLIWSDQSDILWLFICWLQQLRGWNTNDPDQLECLIIATIASLIVCWSWTSDSAFLMNPIPGFL